MDTHWETLALMPRAVSRELELFEQITLDQMPWIPEPHLARRDAIVAKARPKTATSAVIRKPTLRLVASN